VEEQRNVDACCGRGPCERGDRVLGRKRGDRRITLSLILGNKGRSGWNCSWSQAVVSGVEQRFLL
jgi:hypothetical protein